MSYTLPRIIWSGQTGQHIQVRATCRAWLLLSGDELVALLEALFNHEIMSQERRHPGLSLRQAKEAALEALSATIEARFPDAECVEDHR